MKTWKEMTRRVLAVELANGATVLFWTPNRETSRPVAYRDRHGQWYAKRGEEGIHHVKRWLIDYLADLRIARSDVKWVDQDTLDWYVKSL